MSVLDTRTCNAQPSGCTVVGTLQVTAGSPTAIAVNSATGTVYVGTATSGGANRVSVFNGATCNAATTTGCSQPPALMTVGATDGCSFVGVAVNETSNTIYATNTEQCSEPFLGDKVYVYNGATCDATNMTGCGDALATITAGFNPMAIAVDQATNTVYAPLLADGEYAGNVAVINGCHLQRLEHLRLRADTVAHPGRIRSGQRGRRPEHPPRLRRPTSKTPACR